MSALVYSLRKAAFHHRPQPLKSLARSVLPSIGHLHTESKSSSGLIDCNGHLQFNTLHELANNATTSYAANPLFGTYQNDTKAFNWMTYQQFSNEITSCRSVLKDLGVRPYSKVGIISNNRHEWATIAAATYSLNATLVPMYEAQLPKDWIHILNDSDCGTLFCSTEDIYLKVKKEVLGNTPLVREVVCLDAPVGEPQSFAGAMSNVENNNDDEGNGGVIEPLPEDLANLIYSKSKR